MSDDVAPHQPSSFATLVPAIALSVTALLAFDDWWWRSAGALTAGMLAPWLGIALDASFARMNAWWARRSLLARSPIAPLDGVASGAEAHVRGRLHIVEPVNTVHQGVPCAAFVARIRDPGGGSRKIVECGAIEIEDASGRRVKLDAGEWDMLDPFDVRVEVGEARVHGGEEVVVTGRIQERAGQGVSGGYRDEAPTTLVLTPPGRIVPVSGHSRDSTWRRRRPTQVPWRLSWPIVATIVAAYAIYGKASEPRPSPRNDPYVTVAIGEPCDAPLTICVEGARCVQRDERSVCLRSCGSDRPCEEGEICVAEALGGTCVRPAREGEPCDRMQPCEDGFVCGSDARAPEDPEAARRECVPACRRDAECDPGEWCLVFDAEPDAVGVCGAPDDDVLPVFRAILEYNRAQRGDGDAGTTPP